MHFFDRSGVTAVVLPALLLSGSVLSANGQDRISPQPVIRQVDHIVIRSDPDKPLYRLFTEEFQFPVATPSYPSTGWVNAGNVILEFMGVAPSPTEPPSDTEAAFMGFGFEPYPLSESVAELDRRGVARGPVQPNRQDPQSEPFYTLVILTALSERWDGTAPTSMAPEETRFYLHPLRARGLIVLLSEFHEQFWPGTFVQDLGPANRPTWLRELRSRGGGPLGVLGVKEITIGVEDYSDAITRWERVLRPAPSLGDGAWALGEGPAIRLIEAPALGIQSLTFAVQSIGRTRDFLRAQDILGASTAEQVTIAPSAVQGLDFRFVESR
jgi:hypothetical protein